MRIRDLVVNVYNKTMIGLAFFGFLILFVVGPVLMPAVVASSYRRTPIIFLLLSGIIYLVLWLTAFVLSVDAAAYIYGVQRPFFASRGFRLVLSEPTVKTPIAFVQSSLSSYSLTLYAFAIAYVFISQSDPGSFNTRQPLDLLSAIYFTIVTAATVGYGDIFPVSPLARFLVTLEILISFLYVIFIFSTAASFSRFARSVNSTIR